MTARILAEVIIAAATLHEESFDTAMAEELRKLPFADFRKCYKLSLIDACEQAAEDSGFAQPAYLMLQTCWNDALGWANSLVTEEKLVVGTST